MNRLKCGLIFIGGRLLTSSLSHMTYESNDVTIVQDALYSTLFEAMSGSSYLIRNDAPHYTILAATPQILELAGLEKAEVVGRGIFELFPSNPADPADTGEANLRASFEHVLQYKVSHQLPIQRYDVAEGNGSFTERYWRSENRPVLTPDGDIAYIIYVTEDITDQVKAEQRYAKLRGVEKAFSLFMDAPMVVGLVNGDDYVLELANTAALKLWGKGSEIIGRPIIQGLPELKGQGILELFDSVRATGQPYYAYEVPVTSLAEGRQTTHYFDLVYQPYFEDNSSVATGVFTISYDVTEQVEARKAAQESEARFKNLADESPIFVFLIESDPLAPVAYWNKTWLQYTGQTFEEALGRAWNGIIHEEDIPEVMRHYVPAFEKREPYFIPAVRVKRQDGEYRFHAFKGNPRHSSTGQFEGYIGVGLDVHEQRMAEQVLRESEEALERKVVERTSELESQKNLLRNILVNSSNGISVTEVIRDDEGRVIDAITILANDAAVGFTGLPKEVYLSKKATELDPQIFQSPYGQMCLATLKTGEPSFTQYFLEFTGRWLELTISKMDDEHLIHIFTDITPIKEAQLQLERSVEGLRRSNKNLEEFAYAASHDLKEPVRKIHVFSERLKDSLADKLSEAERQYFNRMDLASKRMTTLIDDLLMYSEVSQTAVLNEEVDLNLIVSYVLSDLDLEIEEKKAVVKVGKLFTVKGHRRQLQQAFQNLIGNALKYIKPDTAPVISITCSKVKGSEANLPLKPEVQAKDYYQVTVMDNGIGFDQEDADRIFNVFTRLHGLTEYKGTGVGLSIVRKVIENHNGHIWAESQPGEGATFKILLPVE